MKLRILKRNDVAGLLPIPQAIEQMRGAFSALSAGRAIMPQRSRVEMSDGDMLLMPACLEDTGLCVKMVSIYPGNRQRDLPVIQGALMVYDRGTGRPRVLMDCEELTAIRTAAGGGLAIDLLSRKNSQVLGMIGAGIQAEMQCRAAMVVRNIQKVLVFDTRRESAESFRQAVQGASTTPKITRVDEPGEAVRHADIVITATTSATPVFDGRDVRPGTHITAIGSYRPETRELDEHTVEHAYVVADSREACLAEAGDLIIPGRQPDAELGEIVNRTSPGRTDDQQVTVFKSVGLAVQDAAAADWVCRRAEELDVGVMVEL